MARILYWNINNFSFTKINPTNLQAGSRRTHIVDEVLRGLPAPPDIFVVVEVFARKRDVGVEGVTIGGRARGGVLALLTHIRNQTGQASWSLVPPLWSGAQGYCEGVAVFYNANSLEFTGPYVFGPDYRTATQMRSGAWATPPLNRGCPQTFTAPSTAQLADAAGDPLPWATGPETYPNPWQTCLPARPSPVMFGLNENELAGQWEFWTQAATPKRILFPFDETRSPFYTRFRERTPGPGPKRTIKLFAMHTSPKYAKKGVLKLAKVHELVPAVDEVTVVVGDFNVDTFTNRAGYDKLIGAVGGGVANLGMTMAFRSEDAGAIQLSRRPYCLTHLLPTNRATPNGLLGGVAPSPVQDVYPRFGYMGSMGKKNFKTPVDTGALDNVLTRYGGGLAVGPATNATIVNTVVGRPYNALTPAPANVTVELTGGLPVTPRLLNPILLPVGQDSTSIGAAFGTALFRTWPNFGRLHSTSDHLALVIDV